MDTMTAAPDDLARRRDRLAWIAGLFYLVTFVAGTMALAWRGPVGMAAGAIAAAAYVGVTILFYFLFAPVDQRLSLLAAIVSLTGIGLSAARLLPVHPLVFFGVYCSLLAILVFKSDFVPRALGWLLVVAAIGWFTFAYPPLARSLNPYNFAPGMIGEGTLTVWLLSHLRR
jgi:hypothetical protein